jgi:hypothetical protein
MNESVIYEVREIKTADGKFLYGVFERGKKGMIECAASKLYAEQTAKYYTNLFK